MHLHNVQGYFLNIFIYLFCILRFQIIRQFSAKYFPILTFQLLLNFRIWLTLLKYQPLIFNDLAFQAYSVLLLSSVRNWPMYQLEKMHLLSLRRDFLKPSNTEKKQKQKKTRLVSATCLFLYCGVWFDCSSNGGVLTHAAACGVSGATVHHSSVWRGRQTSRSKGLQ